MSENAHAQTAAKKVAVVVPLTLAPEVEKKTIEELKTEIRKALQEGKSTT